MKRFFREARAAEAGRVFRIELDGRPVRTPAKHALEVPCAALAGAIASEWQSQGDEIDPKSMPLTQLANSAVDRVRPARETVIAEVAGYGGTDLLCYRVENPADLRERQDRAWQPLLDRFAAEMEINLSITRSLTPVEQPQESLRRLFAAVAACDDFRLAGLLSATATTGSVVLGFGLAKAWIDADEAWELAFLDELYQESIWGEDREAAERREHIRHTIGDAVRFLTLSAGQAA